MVGSGWGGFEFIRRLPRRHSYDITVVSPRNYFVFTPLLASTCVGTLEYRAIVESIRTVREAHFFHAFARDIDFDKQHLLCTAKDDETHTHVLEYDRLVIACGAITNTFGVPGVSTHAYFLKDIEDARRIRKRVIDCFDRATEDENYALVNIAVVGGGPTGVELSAELHDLITQDLAYYYPKIAPFAKITIYDVAPRILGAFDAKLAAYAAQKFHREGIRVETGIGVKAVSKDSITLSDDRVVDVGMTVWATGLATNALIKGLRVDKFKLRLLANDKLQVLRNGEPLKNVYAIGDCSSIADNDLPCTAQVAKQEAQYLATGTNILQRSVFAKESFENAPPFRYRYFGSMAYIGDWRAIVDFRVTKRHSLNRGGRLAWIFWRSAYFSMAISVKNKILIPIYWYTVHIPLGF